MAKAKAKSEAKGLEKFVGSEVVVDTATPIVYIGRLEEVDESFLTLADCDVHDTTEGSSTKELYCIEAKKHGVKKNRARVKVRQPFVVSVSLLEDVIEY